MSAGIVIIGSGYCGANAAFSARENGFSGSITLIGSEGAVPYERPPLSKWDNGDLGSPRPIYPPEKYGEYDIELLSGCTVSSINRTSQNVHLDSGEVIPYHRLLLATGARAREFEQDQWPGVEIHYLRSHEDAKSIRGKLSVGMSALIIGAGFIGLEMAASLSNICANVTVLESNPTVLSRALPEQISELVANLHRRNGTDLRTSTNIHSIVKTEADIFVSLSNGEVLNVDITIAGIGSEPNVELAKAAGIHVDNGIVVNDKFQTSDENIFAAGDCCNFPTADGKHCRMESWQVAGDQGTLAGKSMANMDINEKITPWFWSDQFDYTTQVVGIGDASAKQVVRRTSETALIVFQIDETKRLASAAGIGKGLEISKDIRLSQKIIESNIQIDPISLENPNKSLKEILRG